MSGPDTKVDILLVDDEVRNLDALAAILADPGYRLLRAADADTALKLLLQHDVAAIMLDVKMPGTNGLELAKIIKATKRFRQIPIVFLTAYLLDHRDIITGYGAGAVDYLTKPLEPEIVRHKVAVFADLFRKTRALADLNATLEERVRERTAELESSEEALREADRRKDEFIAILAHELRNPLAPIRFGLDVLSRQAQASTPVIASTLAAMNRQINHVTRLVDDLLDVSRMSRGTIELKKQRIEIGSAIQAAIDFNRPLLERRRHRVTLDVEQGLDVHADPTRIAQIVSNLIHNAAKFTAEGGQIAVEARSGPDDAVIRVTDSGQGIPADQLERMFEMFARSSRTAGAEPGLGIGLALARRLAVLHGGALTAESEGEGRGACFTLRLPRLDSTGRLARRAEPSAATEPLGSLSIVLIEDNEDIVETLTSLLESMGHRVAVAGSGAGGVALVERSRPQMVLCDLGLPEMDGIEVCRRVRRLELGTQPVMIAMTGWGRVEDKRRTREAGFDHHLVKPIDAATLHDMIRAVAF